MTTHAVLLNWNQGIVVGAILDRLLSQQDVPLRIWVVDNASDSPDRNAIGEFSSKIRLIQNESNLGYAGGINAALRAIHADAGENDRILLLNNDIEFTGDCITKLASALDTHPEAGMAGPVLVEGTEQHPRLSWGGRDIGSHLFTRMPDSPALIPDDGCFTVDYTPGTVLLMRASLLSEIGFLDEEYFFSGEIADFAARAATAGQSSIICSSCEAKHMSDDAGSNRNTLYRYYSLRNRFLYCRKHHADKKLIKYTTWTLIGLAMATVCLLKGQFSAARASCLAILDGWKGRFGNQHERINA